MSLHGEIQTMPLPDLFQWLELMQKTGSLALVYGEKEPRLYFNRGAIAGASLLAGNVTGREEDIASLLSETLQWPEGEFDFSESPLPGEVLATETSLHAQQMVLDAFRKFDEEQGELLDEPPAAKAEEEVSSGLSYNLRVAIVDRVLNGDFKIPLLPMVAKKVLEISRRENYSLRDLGDAIITDQVIAAQVLKLANTGAYGGERPVGSLALAVQRLGSQAVTNLVLALSLQSSRGGNDLFLSARQQLWEHASACSLLSRMVAQAIRLDRDIAFLCGLMMDFGKMVLFTLIQEVMLNEPRYKTTPIEAINGIVETFHPKVGGVISENWCLPQPVTEAILCHHALHTAKQHRAYAAVSGLSDDLITLFEREPDLLSTEPGASGQRAEELVKSPAASILNLNSAQMQAILERVPECLKYAKDILVK